MASTLPTFNDLQNYTGTLTYLNVTGGVTKVADVTALRALPTSDDNVQAIVEDLGGFGAAAFWWDSDSVAADDGLTVIAPSDGGTGRWIRLV